MEKLTASSLDVNRFRGDYIEYAVGHIAAGLK